MRSTSPCADFSCNLQVCKPLSLLQYADCAALLLLFAVLLQPKRGALVAEICDALTASETVPSSIMWTL
jgi:hypothetical protein